MYPGQEQIENIKKMPEALLLALGRFYANWSVLENELNVAVCSLLKINMGAGLALIKSLRSAQEKQDLILRIFKETHPDNEAAYNKLKKIMDGIHSVRAYRNKIVHGTWSCEGNQGVNVNFKFYDDFDRDNEFREEIVHPDNLNDASANMLELAEKLGRFLK